MATQLSGLIRDQNLNIHYNGASAGGKNNGSKPLKKGGLGGGRKPLGDLSNAVNPAPVKSLKKQNSNICSFTEKETSASNVTFDGSKKKGLSKAPEKRLTSGRKALSDISNSGKPHLQDASKKNLNSKLSVLEEEHLSAIAEERFLHNHQECIKAQTKAMDIDELLRTVGLDNYGFTKQPAAYSWAPPPSETGELKPPGSPLKYMELEEMAEHQFEDQSNWKDEEQFSELDPPTPKSPKQWMMDHDQINFMLMASP